MAINFALALGIHDKALAAHSNRAEILAHNIVNADTPGYKARDVDFKELLAEQLGAGSEGPAALTRMTNARHIPLPGSTPGLAELKYRVPLQPSLDGNTVDMQIEQAEFAKNALRFQASLTFLSSKFRGLTGAIRGE